MIDNLKDALKGIIKLLGGIFYLIGYPFFKLGEWTSTLKFSIEIKLEEEARKKAEEMLNVKLPVVKKKQVRKKKVIEPVITQ